MSNLVYLTFLLYVHVQHTALDEPLAPCFTWGLTKNQLVLNCTLPTSSTNVNIFRPSGQIQTSCNVITQNCITEVTNGSVSISNRRVMFSLPRDDDVNGKWSCHYGEHYITTVVSSEKGIENSIDVKIKGSAVRGNNYTVFTISMETCFSTDKYATELLVNNIHKDTLWYNKERDMCFQGGIPCTEDVCECLKGNKFKVILTINNDDGIKNISFYSKFFDGGKSNLVFKKEVWFFFAGEVKRGDPTLTALITTRADTPTTFSTEVNYGNPTHLMTTETDTPTTLSNVISTELKKNYIDSKLNIIIGVLAVLAVFVVMFLLRRVYRQRAKGKKCKQQTINASIKEEDNPHKALLTTTNTGELQSNYEQNKTVQECSVHYEDESTPDHPFVTFKDGIEATDDAQNIGNTTDSNDCVRIKALVPSAETDEIPSDDKQTTTIKDCSVNDYYDDTSRQKITDASVQYESSVTSYSKHIDNTNKEKKDDLFTDPLDGFNAIGNAQDIKNTMVNDGCVRSKTFLPKSDNGKTMDNNGYVKSKEKPRTRKTKTVHQNSSDYPNKARLPIKETEWLHLDVDQPCSAKYWNDGGKGKSKQPTPTKNQNLAISSSQHDDIKSRPKIEKFATKNLFSVNTENDQEYDLDCQQVQNVCGVNKQASFRSGKDMVNEPEQNNDSASHEEQSNQPKDLKPPLPDIKGLPIIYKLPVNKEHGVREGYFKIGSRLVVTTFDKDIKHIVEMDYKTSRTFSPFFYLKDDFYLSVNENVCVLFPKKNYIDQYNIDSKRHCYCKLQFTIEGKLIGFSIYKGNIYIATRLWVYTVNLDGEKCFEKETPVTNVHKFAVDNDRLFFMTTDTLYCCLLDCKIEWSFIMAPSTDNYLTTDGQGQVYVASADSYSVEVLSIKDKHANKSMWTTKQTHESEIQNIHYDKTDNSLLVTDNSNVVSIYSIAHS